MILLDTNVLIYASDRESSHHAWAREIIADAVMGEGAAVNTVILAELCVGDATPETVRDRVREWGITVCDVPATTAAACAAAYLVYRERRTLATGKLVPATPLPDFFIGAHASILGWNLATADEGRFRSYFPEVTLLVPPR